MGTGMSSSPDFVIGNRAEEMFEIVLSICSPKKGGTTFPDYVRKEYTDEMIRTARGVLRDVIYANGSRGESRLRLQESAQNGITYLTFLIRAAYDKKWISEKQHERVARILSELTKRIWNWKRADLTKR